ncbi:MAG: hypothetical protein Q9N02_01210, partial [Ghiorsea sp.]|nr:hypothetical protein [Ghiorsea sp.]
DDEAFVKQAYVEQAVKLLPGSYLATSDGQSVNAGSGYVRAALVDGVVCASELGNRLRNLL